VKVTSNTDSNGNDDGNDGDGDDDGNGDDYGNGDDDSNIDGNGNGHSNSNTDVDCNGDGEICNGDGNRISEWKSQQQQTASIMHGQCCQNGHGCSFGDSCCCATSGDNNSIGRLATRKFTKATINPWQQRAEIAT